MELKLIFYSYLKCSANSSGGFLFPGDLLRLSQKHNVSKHGEKVTISTHQNKEKTLKIRLWKSRIIGR